MFYFLFYYDLQQSYETFCNQTSLDLCIYNLWWPCLSDPLGFRWKVSDIVHNMQILSICFTMVCDDVWRVNFACNIWIFWSVWVFKATFSVHKITTKNTQMPTLHIYTNFTWLSQWFIILDINNLVNVYHHYWMLLKLSIKLKSTCSISYDYPICISFIAKERTTYLLFGEYW